MTIFLVQESSAMKTYIWSTYTIRYAGYDIFFLSDTCYEIFPSSIMIITFESFGFDYFMAINVDVTVIGQVYLRTWWFCPDTNLPLQIVTTTCYLLFTPASGRHNSAILEYFFGSNFWLHSYSKGPWY